MKGESTITLSVGSSELIIDNTSITLKSENIYVKGTTQSVIGPDMEKCVKVEGGGCVNIVGEPVNINKEKGGIVNSTSKCKFT